MRTVITQEENGKTRFCSQLKPLLEKHILEFLQQVSNATIKFDKKHMRCILYVYVELRKPEANIGSLFVLIKCCLTRIAMHVHNATQ